MLYTINICFEEKGLRCYSLIMGDVVKKRNSSSGIHRLLIDNEVIEDPKFIDDHNLNFYKNLYVESISNVLDTSNMEDLIGTYILELVSSEENMMLINVLIF